MMLDRSLSPTVYFHLHLVSDATGETLNAVAKAACAQFANVSPLEHIHALVRSKRQLERALIEIEAQPGLVLYTLMNPELREILRVRCAELNVTALSVLDPVLGAMAGYLGTELLNRPGGQHELDAKYFGRIDALNFAMAHDDGQNTGELDKADVVLVGVSRTSKTPTCIYLANRGLRAANIPFVLGVPLPEGLATAKRPLIVGLIAAPERLVQVRRNRLLALNERKETSYVDVDRVREEVLAARRYFEDQGWPVIDVSRRSIEETAASIFNLLSEREAQSP
jgi:[pyruvate, water dikinase]-phosphate phosphotransferase / [pyruvate, water dikinase] kinase